MTADVAVQVRGVRKAFGATVALDGVDLTVQSGELFGLVGPDGGGKTTLFRILTTLLLPDTGSATVLGLDTVRDLWPLRARIGYMPGRFALYADLTVAENLEFFASVFGTTAEAGRALIAPIYDQIARFADRRAGALSGGMKQKLALSCALVHRPDILFLDEPTTGVDAVSRREFWDLLDTLRAGGLTTVVSTPYMDEASRCDRVALMQGGRLLAIDHPAQLGARYPRPLYAVTTAWRIEALAALRAMPTVASALPFGERLHVSDRRVDRAPAEIAAALAASLRAAGFTDAIVAPIAPDIEDTFIELMGAPPRAVA
ncbi:MAG: ABC transporter ATP-binding protein [Gemmatimonadetes bacterium]|nr:ABC transporter ATP-binding protein [Gemmatimonadota bacterium]